MVSDAYLAGFFDGEGSIGMYKRKAWSLQVTVSQKDHAVLDVFFERFPLGAWNYFENVTSLVWYDWRTHELLRALVPYMITKKRQAVLALQFAEMQQRHVRGRAWTPEERAQIEQIANDIKQAKKAWDRSKRGI